MPVYSLNDQGFFDGSRAIMQGIQGYRQKKQQDLENKWHDDEFGLQRSRLDLERQSQQSRSAMDQAKFDEEKQTGGLSRDLMRRKLQPVQFDPAKHIKTGPDGTQYIVDPESGAVTRVIESDPGKEWLRRRLAPPPTASAQLGTPPVGTNSVLNPAQPAGAPPGQLPPLNDFVLKGINSSGPVFAPKGTDVPPSIMEVDVPGGGKQQFIEQTDPVTGEKKYEVYHGAKERQIGDEVLNKLNVTSLALSQLPEIEKAVESAGTSGGPLVGRVQDTIDKWGGTPNEHQRAFGSINARMLAPIAKGLLGETGALSQADMERYAPLLPSYLDSKQSRQEKVARLRQLITGQRDNILQNLKATGRDTGALASSPSMQVPGAPPDAKPPTITSQAEYDALPNGAKFIDDSGQVKVKGKR